MTLKIAGFVALVFAALALIPSGAHLAELPNKMGLPEDEYRTVQQIYRGWSLFGVVVVGALISTLSVVIMIRRFPGAFRLALFALLCLVGAQVIFWALTFPVNQMTEGWTVLPPNWTELRERWEYSHAAAAGLHLVAFISLAGALMVGGQLPPAARARG